MNPPSPGAPYEPGEEGSIPQALRTLTLRFPAWCLWYGKATEQWWALSPARCRQRIGLIEADTPAELAARMQHIEDSHPHPEQHDQPISTDHRTAVRDIRVAGDSQTSKGGDRDDRATAVRTRRRAR
ncbi:hypothetical protein ABT061_13040 [Streptosporangium sp. NPDC002544]|uniref:hypothetical protein n=1 Tax=Streptosporangium sp. NPDC002544 TaxID=3154538 RepID=UPI00332DD141